MRIDERTANEFYGSNAQKDAIRAVEPAVVAPHAERIHAGMEQVYREGKVLTRDVGGKSGTKAFADAVLEAMDSPAAAS